MRQEHRAGEKLFLDFSGDGLEIVNPKILCPIPLRARRQKTRSVAPPAPA